MNPEILKSLLFLNPWWQTGKVPAELALPFRRRAFSALLSYFSLTRVIILKGPRQTGKSTIFYQLIEELIKNGVKPQNILYLSFDILGKQSLGEIFASWETAVKQTIKEMGKAYVFLDEVSYLPSWSLMVKKYFDKKIPIKFLASSSSASLFERETESLAGRTVEEILFPFSLAELSEYLYKITLPKQAFDIEKIDMTEFLPYESQLKVALEKYLEKGGFPHILAVSEKTLWQKLLREDVIGKVIYRDIATLYQVKKPVVLESIFSYAQATTSGILNISQLSNFSGLSREYTEKYLFYLERAYLLFRLGKFSRSPKEVLRSNKKLHLVDPGLAAINPQVDPNSLFESTVASHLVRIFSANLFYWRNKTEIDLILRMGKNLIPCEVKNSPASGEAIKNVLEFLERTKENLGMVIYRGEYQKLKIKRKTIFLFPAWLILGAI